MTDNRKPKRIRRRRTKGWRMPEGAVYVGRPTKWGNRFHVDDPYPGFVDKWIESAAVAVGLYEADLLMNHPELIKQAREELRGRDLVCWCPRSQICHADVLLKIANEP